MYYENTDNTIIKETIVNQETENNVSRNDPCPCGSGKKFKNCHGLKGAKNVSQSKIPILVIVVGIVVIGAAFGYYQYQKSNSSPVSQPTGQLGLDPFSSTDPSTQTTPTTGYYSDIPDVDLAGLSDTQTKTVLDKANSEQCTCGCPHSLAACIITDPGCPLVESNKVTINGYVSKEKGE
jgi:hypothetical protein